MFFLRPSTNLLVREVELKRQQSDNEAFLWDLKEESKLPSISRRRLLEKLVYSFIHLFISDWDEESRLWFR